MESLFSYYIYTPVPRCVDSADGRAYCVLHRGCWSFTQHLGILTIPDGNCDL